MVMQNKVLKVLSNKADGFYLAGGTALSLFYFHHRESYDLDFFIKDFSKAKAETIIRHVCAALKVKAELKGEQSKKDKTRILVYNLKDGKNILLKLDFVEDFYSLLKPLKVIDGISVMSIEDIYMRKIFAACGTLGITDLIGKKRFVGGRQEAKDFFDLYYLSKTFMPFSAFVIKYCGAAQIESVIVWYRTYDRIAIKLGLNDIISDKSFDYQEMERHFRHEIEEIIKKEM